MILWDERVILGLYLYIIEVQQLWFLLPLPLSILNFGIGNCDLEHPTLLQDLGNATCKMGIRVIKILDFRSEMTCFYDLEQMIEFYDSTSSHL